VVEVWPEKLKVCSDITVGRVVHGTCFMSPRKKYLLSAGFVRVLEVAHSDSVSLLTA